MTKMTSFLLLSLFFSAALASVNTWSNDWYKVVVDEQHGYWAAATGTEHPGSDPVDGAKEILWGGVDEDPFTVYFTIFSQSTGQTYTNNHNLANTLDDETVHYLVIDSGESNQNGDSYSQTFNVDGSDKYGDEDFSVKITYELIGTTFENAAILFSTELKNLGPNQLVADLRWQMDYNLMGDDGCAFATVMPDSGRYIFEKEWVGPKFDQYLISPNGLSTAFYEAYGPVTGPVNYLADPTVPTKVQFASYTANTEIPYDTQINTDDQVVYSNIQDDSVVMLYFRYQTLQTGEKDVVKSAISSIFVLSDENGVIVCDDGWACTYDHIAVKAGEVQQCLHIPQHYYCDDNNKCTIDSCEQLNYVYKDEGEYFDEASGCLHLPKDCSDGIFCTSDLCDEATGECSWEATDCNDGFACTDDECNEELGGCINTPNDYYCRTEGEEAGNKCVNTWCDEFRGCQWEDVICDDQIGCTDNYCNSDEGCYFEANEAHCNDDEPCTLDFCNKALGKCENTAVDSRCVPEDETFDPCMDYWCDVNDGCKSTPKVCDGPDTACLFHMCISGECVAFAMDHLCNDTNYCTDERCSPELGKCESIPNDGNCDDGLSCTVNWCDPINGCKYEPIVCDDHIVCTINDRCDEDEGCLSDPEDSLCNDDEKSCTVDTCDPAKGCLRVYDNSLCNDNNPCTEDYCWGAAAEAADGCVHIYKVCDDDIFCTENLCNEEAGEGEGECYFPVKDNSCDDDIACTSDVCDTENLLRCVNTPINTDCDDLVDCTIDVCDAYQGCLNNATDKLCEDGFDCTLNWCDKVLGCQVTTDSDLCDDNVECTVDVCTETQGCTFTADNSKCEDNIVCHINVCGENGCETTYDVDACEDDNIACTETICNATGCHHVARDSWCDDDVACTADICDPTYIGDDQCVHIVQHALCSDGRDCSLEVCDLDLGCVIEESNCPEDEDSEHCVNCKSGLSRLVADDLEDGSGDLIIATRNFRVLPYTVASSVQNLTENLKIKGSGAIVLGNVEHLAADDGLVIGHGSAFRLVPTQGSDSAPACNELNRGLIRFVEEVPEGSTYKIDEMYICLANVGSYEWKKLLN